MKKKLIKTIASVTCGLGIVGSIPFIATSCGESNIIEDKYIEYNDEYFTGDTGFIRGFYDQKLEKKKLMIGKTEDIMQ